MAQIIKRGLDADTDLTRFAPAIKAAGISHVGRYLKNVTRSEIAACHAAGLGMWFIYEITATRALYGVNTGLLDGERAAAQAASLGIPKDVCIFATCDTDPTASQVPNVVAYGQGFAQSFDHAGFYACGAVLSASKLVPWLAGASGWNGSKAYAPTGAWVMQQGPDLNGHAASWAGIQWPALGFDYDPNLIAREDFGLWLPASGAPTIVTTSATSVIPAAAPSAPLAPTLQPVAPKPDATRSPPIPPNMPEFLKQWQRFLGVADDGVWGPNTAAAFEAAFS